MLFRTRTHTTLFGLGLGVLMIPIWLSFRHSNASVDAGALSITTSARSSVFVVPLDFQATLIRAGLDPHAIATAGLLPNEVTPVLQAAADQINGNPTALSQADSSYAAARVESDQLLRKIQSGLATPEDITAYQSALTNFNTATAQRQAALDATFAAATPNLSAEQRTTLGRIRANRAQDWSRDFPTEFLVIAREEVEWVHVRDALANEHIALKHPDLISETAQQSLAAWRAEPAVLAAKTALDQNLTAVTAAWNTATGGR
jgi:hypothetical protein